VDVVGEVSHEIAVEARVPIDEYPVEPLFAHETADSLGPPFVLLLVFLAPQRKWLLRGLRWPFEEAAPGTRWYVAVRSRVVLLRLEQSCELRPVGDHYPAVDSLAVLVHPVFGGSELALRAGPWIRLTKRSPSRSRCRAVRPYASTNMALTSAGRARSIMH
jgi:hypothetical protein